MSAFASNFAASAGTALLSVHGEQGTYTPRAGAARPVVAIITRNPPEPVNAAPNWVAPIAIIKVLNAQASAVTDGYGGISSDELDCGGDMFTFAVRIGETPTARRITKPLSQDAGMLELEVR